jgi:glycerol-3-phosphate dehydrogenase
MRTPFSLSLKKAAQYLMILITPAIPSDTIGAMKQQRDKLDFDLLVVGGGINGAGIARDAAGRGLSVVLCEKDDLASHTSSASTKLIHGGLRYLEYYEFSLVRKALIEREVLLRSAPHIMHPLRFVMPHEQGLRPAWLIRAGLFLYDSLARRVLLRGSRGVSLRRHVAGEPLAERFKRGFIYSDGWVDDARLVVLNAIDAAEKGATIFTHTACEALSQTDGKWTATLRRKSGGSFNVQARCVVNATGPWAAHFLQGPARHQGGRTLRMVKGSHIVVKRLFDHPYAYIFQHPDGRIVFAIPYEREFTLIGTTDIEYRGDLDRVSIDASEIAYLCELTNHYFRQSISPTEVIWSFSGVRPLVDEDAGSGAGGKAAAVTRDYRFELDHDGKGGAPILSIFGGKITTFRKLAEEAVDMLAPLLANSHGRWTADACLPGGDLFGPVPTNRSVQKFDQYVYKLQREYSWLAPSVIERYAHAYGSRTAVMLQSGAAGEEILPGLFASEVDYLLTHEWAQNAEDILWRRSKLGLHLPPDSAAKLDAWIAARRSGQRELAQALAVQSAALL